MARNWTPKIGMRVRFDPETMSTYAAEWYRVRNYKEAVFTITSINSTMTIGLDGREPYHYFWRFQPVPSKFVAKDWL